MLGHDLVAQAEDGIEFSRCGGDGEVDRVSSGLIKRRV